MKRNRAVSACPGRHGWRRASCRRPAVSRWSRRSALAGLDRALSAALAPWRKPMAIHDPAKVITDLAVTLALGGDCLADIALLRAEPAVFGPVASDPTVSRTIDALAADADRGADRDRHGPRGGPGRGVVAGREHAPDHAVERDAAADHRRRRHAGHRALGEGAGGADVQARLRVPPAVDASSTTARRHR